MREIICLVGAGGKTTLMQRLALEKAENKIKTVITTSTHIQRPGDRGLEGWTFVSRKDDLLVYEKEGVILLGRCGEGNKLSGVFAEEHTEESDMPVTSIDRLLPGCSGAKDYFAKAEAIFIEADGSKRRPFKMPRSNEPVIISECTKVIAVMGMKCAGKSLFEAGFGYDRGPCRREASEIITPEMIAAVLTEYDGAYKGVNKRDYTIVLNQCDNDYRKECAKRTIDAIIACAGKSRAERSCEICTAVNGVIIDRAVLQ